MALAALGLEADVALARAGLAGAADDLAVDRELDRAVVALDAVVVPLAGGLSALLAGEAALPPVRVGPVGLHFGPVD